MGLTISLATTCRKVARILAFAYTFTYPRQRPHSIDGLHEKKSSNVDRFAVRCDFILRRGDGPTASQISSVHVSDSSNRIRRERPRPACLNFRSLSFVEWGLARRQQAWIRRTSNSVPAWQGCVPVILEDTSHHKNDGSRARFSVTYGRRVATRSDVFSH